MSKTNKNLSIATHRRLRLLLGGFLIFAAFLASDLPASLLFTDIEAQVGALLAADLVLPGAANDAPWRLIDGLAACLLLAACSRLAQMPFGGWQEGTASAPPAIRPSH